MYTVEIAHIAKSFGEAQAVADVSFAVQPGEIFGLLGPNGAGKTTTIRLMLGIFQPDRGTASVLGGPMTEAKKARIGYMPEERGLYQDAPLERCLVYLGTLKGLASAEARQRVGSYLERFDLAVHKSKKVKELSKGMQQKAQIISTVLHNPELIIVDEPFAALDPVNVQLVKDLLCELRDQGKTILMSTHQMHQVEELCDRILLIDHGRDVLYGRLDEIRRRAARSSREVWVRAAGEGPLDSIRESLIAAGVEAVVPHNSAMRVTLAEGMTSQDLLRSLLAQQVVVERFEIAVPSLEEVFIQVVSGRWQEGGA